MTIRNTFIVNYRSEWGLIDAVLTFLKQGNKTECRARQHEALNSGCPGHSLY